MFVKQKCRLWLNPDPNPDPFFFPFAENLIQSKTQNPLVGEISDWRKPKWIGKSIIKHPKPPIRFWHGLINVVLSSGVHVVCKEGSGTERQSWSTKRKQGREARTIEEVKGLPFDPMKEGVKTVPMKPLHLQRETINFTFKSLACNDATLDKIISEGAEKGGKCWWQERYRVFAETEYKKNIRKYTKRDCYDEFKCAPYGPKGPDAHPLPDVKHTKLGFHCDLASLDYIQRKPVRSRIVRKIDCWEYLVRVSRRFLSNNIFLESFLRGCEIVSR